MSDVASFFPPLNNEVEAYGSVDLGLPVLCATLTNTSYWLQPSPSVPKESILVILANATEASYAVFHPTSLVVLVPNSALALPSSYDRCKGNQLGCKPQCVTYEHESVPHLAIMDAGGKKDVLFTIGNQGALALVAETVHSQSFRGFAIVEEVPHVLQFTSTVEFLPAETKVNQFSRSTLKQPGLVQLMYDSSGPVGTTLANRIVTKSATVYSAEDIGLPRVLAEFEDSTLGKREMDVLSVVNSVAPENLGQAIATIPESSTLFSVKLDTGEEAVLLPAKRSILLYSIETGQELDRLCCSTEPLAAIGSAVISEGKTRIFTVSENGLVERWTLEGSGIQLPTKYNSGAAVVSDLIVSSGRLLVFAGSGIKLYSTEPAPLSAESIDNTLALNITMFIILAIFVFLSLRFRPRFHTNPGMKEPPTRGSNAPPTLIDSLQEDEENDPSLLGRARRCCASSWMNIKIFLGIKVSMEEYEVRKLQDYTSERLNLLLGPLTFLRATATSLRSRCSKQEDSHALTSGGVQGKSAGLPNEGFFSYFNMYRTHVFLVTYLIFVGVTFSPNVFGSFLGPAAGPTNGKVCDSRELKLMAIKEDLLEASNYSAGEIQISELIQRPDEMAALVEEANERLKSDPPFPNFPNFTRCDNFIEEKRVELIQQIQKDDCRFESESVLIITKVSHRYEFPDDKFTAHTERKELPPPSENSRQCPIDPSLLTDIEQLRELIGGYVEPQSRAFEEVDEAVADAYVELMKTLVFQANFAADMYIFYVCVCLFVKPPLRLSKPRTDVLVRKFFFNWPQLTFIFAFTVFFYVLPILLHDYDFEKLFEQWRRFFANAGVDMCYVQPSFIAEVTETLFDTCEEIEDLEQEYLGVVQQATQVSRDAASYFLCKDTPAEVQLVLDELERIANETLETPFATQLCDSIGFNVLLDQYSNPKPPDVEIDFLGAAIPAISVILQLLGKFILVNFGLSLAHTLDPLSFHGGRVEVIRSNKALRTSSSRSLRRTVSTVEANQHDGPPPVKTVDAEHDDEVLPPAAHIAQFLKRTYFCGMIYHLLLVMFFLVNLAIILDAQVDRAREVDRQAFAALVCVSILVLAVVARYLWKGEKEVTSRHLATSIDSQ